MHNISENCSQYLKRDSLAVVRNVVFQPEPLRYPGGLVDIDKTLDTYRTLTFEENTGNIKRKKRGLSIAEQYCQQAERLASIKKQQKNMRLGVCVPNVTDLGAIKRTEDEEF